ncbi:hypothetical protein [Streptomyces sp. NPDC048272]|uniref:hypothetical protein n=1 Tax=Streptomyces sp. NPDC048272 TaxID=3154616 RepID=UPI0034259AF8
MTATLGGAPGLLIVAAFLCFALAIVVMAIQSVFPQESEHRLDWWRDRRRHQRLRRQAAVRARNKVDDGSRARATRRRLGPSDVND